MATADRRATHPLNERIVSEFGRFNVFQLVRLLRWEAHTQARAAGRREPPAFDARVRFRAELSAAFPGSEVARLAVRAPARPDGAGRVELFTPNYCVASELGPLPEPYTEWARDLARDGAPAFAAFLDLFNHRFNMLRHQLKASQQIGLNYLHPDETRHAGYLAALMGIGLPDLAAQLPLPRRAWLGLAGLLANCRRSAAGIEHVLACYLGVPVRLTPLVGAWRALEPGDRQALGRQGHRLGQTCLIGGRIWDQQARIRLTVDPLPYARFVQLLPRRDAPPADGRPGFAAFAALLAFLVDRRVDVEVVLQAEDASVPPRRLLTRDDAQSHALRLSQSAWLASRHAAGLSAHGGARLGRNARLGDGAPRPPRRVTYLIRAFAGSTP
ncbi:type VI secretion system baseplate subunit TssG [Chitiniphilus purpureus]|uniref:Type VI secretion system baseplate subunit TssG n=1 Tax=Chitiniphilus purpureus TaxID=2981137 RepID=A0ABY6DU40_9NEIS|nr:type VI secretion system baseplate subunit TssG [Chitiniphilus sp. CD1]UXY17243.1 type VI secretion system baseplate subunit TssG [Chitiniphilus sp. CD1]